MDCTVCEPDDFDYQGTLMRPPSEHASILIQATVGCSHNKCTFCNAYREKRPFIIKSREILSRDFRFAARYCRRQARVFLMDGDALILPYPQLVWILEQIREQLPWVKRVGLYANGKSVRSKTDVQLRELARLGLGIAYFGVESGDDSTLTRIRKGSTSEQLIREGRRLEDAGIAASVTVLLGIAGRERSLVHARATGNLLTAMNPSYVGALSVMVMPGTPLAEEQARGAYELPSAHEMLLELREMVAQTDLTHGLFRANHASNYLPLKITYPHGKAEGLRHIEAALKGEIELVPEYFRGL